MATFRITATTLNLRDAASLASNIIGSLQRNNEVDGSELSADGAWRRVRTAAGQDGWVADRYLAPRPDPTDGAVAPPPWLSVAEEELAKHIVEIPGPEDNPRIVDYQSATDLHATDDETPWCSAFVNWCMKEAGIQRTNKAAARSWLNWGQQLGAPRLGCVTVLSRTGDPTKGHVAFYLGPDGTARIRLLGGNQGNAVSIATFPAERVLSHRWPA